MGSRLMPVPWLSQPPGQCTPQGKHEGHRHEADTSVELLFGMALTLGAVPASAQPQQVAASMSPAADAGTRTCLTCHGSDPKVTAILKSPMAVMGDPRTPFAQGGCVSCHGPSANHIAMKAPFPDIVFAGPHKSPVEGCATRSA